jgi:S-formylglutathione hydrolase FrmB
MSGRVEIQEFQSALLAGNRLGDSALRHVPVYLPPGYGVGDADYPVLYALAGFTGSAASYLNYDWYQENLPTRLDRLITDGVMAPCLVVMVEGMTRVGGNQYIDSSAVGPWASHIIQELVPWIERTFRVRAGRDHRGVFGKSSGGYGALMMAIEHADVFAGAVSHSGDSYFEYCYGPDFPKAVDALQSVGGVKAFLAGLPDWGKFPGRLFPALNIVAMAHFYSPNGDHPLGFDLPFDQRTGERREDVLLRWRERDPVYLVERHAAAMKSLRHLWIECGAKDEYNLHHGARILSARLRDHGVRHHHEEFDDDHRSLNYRYDVSLPPLVAALA